MTAVDKLRLGGIVGLVLAVMFAPEIGAGPLIAVLIFLFVVMIVEAVLKHREH